MRSADDLRRLVEAGDSDGVISLLLDASEKERKTLAPAALQCLRQHDRMAALAAQVRSGVPTRVGASLRALEPYAPVHEQPASRDAARAAFLATAGWGEVKRLHSWCAPRPAHAWTILTDRRPGWLQKWAEMVCAEGARLGGFFLLLRRLEREEIVPRFESSAYWAGMAASLPDGSRPLREALLADPELLTGHVWRMLSDAQAVEEIASRQGLPGDRQRQNDWRVTLVALSEERHLDREQLLDAALDALVTASPAAARWLVALHAQLQPDNDERRSRRERYLRLLACRTTEALDFAFDILEQLAADRKLPAHDLADHVAPALLGRTKATALRALALIEVTARRNPNEIVSLSVTATHAFEHERPDVHAAACRLLAAFGPPTDEAVFVALRERLNVVSASSRAQVEAWLQVGAAPAPIATSADEEAIDRLATRAEKLPSWASNLANVNVALTAARNGGPPPPALVLDPLKVPRLGIPVDPPGNLEETVDLLLALLEGRGTGLDVERALAALACFSAERPANFDDVTTPLSARASERLQTPAPRVAPLFGHPEADLALAVLAWTRGPQLVGTLGELARRAESGISTPWGHVKVEPTAGSFLSRRVFELAQHLAARSAVSLLAVPTHSGAFLDPRVLVERALKGNGTGPLDAIQSLLRLAPDHRGEALVAAHGLPGEFGSAVRHALGGSGESIGPNRGLWVAAARARQPAGDDAAVDAHHPRLGPDGALAVRFDVRATTRRGMGGERVLSVLYRPDAPRPRDFDLPTVSWHYEEGMLGAGTLAASWTNTIWPLAREALFAKLAKQASAFRDSQGTYWIGDVEPAFDPDVQAGPMFCLFLAVALGARHPNSARLAQDALLAAIDDGRVDARGLGEALERALVSGTVTVVRWVRAFRESARVSPLHRHVFRVALAKALEGQETPTLALLELLNEWCAEDGAPVANERLRARLATVRSGKGARLARELLDRDAAPGCDRAAAVRALTGRIERAERWARLFEAAE